MRDHRRRSRLNFSRSNSYVERKDYPAIYLPEVKCPQCRRHANNTHLVATNNWRGEFDDTSWATATEWNCIGSGCVRYHHGSSRPFAVEIVCLDCNSRRWTRNRTVIALATESVTGWPQSSTLKEFYRSLATELEREQRIAAAQHLLIEPERVTSRKLAKRITHDHGFARHRYAEDKCVHCSFERKFIQQASWPCKRRFR